MNVVGIQRKNSDMREAAYIAACLFRCMHNRSLRVSCLHADNLTVAKRLLGYGTAVCLASSGLDVHNVPQMNEPSRYGRRF
jgi:hypothetical protein